MTDFKGYGSMKAFISHRTVNHSAKQYVNGVYSHKHIKEPLNN